MGQQQWDGNGQPATCRTRASAAPSIQSNNQLFWTVWGDGDNREGQFGGIEPQKRVEVELIEWRSLDLHSINSKSIFHPPQGGKHMENYSACVLGVRLRYRRHGKHINWQWKRGRLGVSCSAFPEGGFGPSSFYLDIHSVLVKNYLGKPYTIWKLLFCSFMWFPPFFMGISFLPKKLFQNKTEYSLKGG